jgi:hypothetical protein
MPIPADGGAGQQGDFTHDRARVKLSAGMDLRDRGEAPGVACGEGEVPERWEPSRMRGRQWFAGDEDDNRSGRFAARGSS